MEGIHGLNEKLTDSVPAEAKYKIYISALTQLCIDDHNRIFTSDTRLMRRLVRDRRYRGYSAAETILRWPSVRRGENRNIFPFQEQADVMFNSALVYEHAVLKPYIERYLMEVPQDDPVFVHAYRLLRFLRLIMPVFRDTVPPNSILREFVGESVFEY
jgi:uridine kinase